MDVDREGAETSKGEVVDEMKAENGVEVKKGKGKGKEKAVLEPFERTTCMYTLLSSPFRFERSKLTLFFPAQQNVAKSTTAPSSERRNERRQDSYSWSSSIKSLSSSKMGLIRSSKQHTNDSPLRSGDALSISRGFGIRRNSSSADDSMLGPSKLGGSGLYVHFALAGVLSPR